MAANVSSDEERQRRIILVGEFFLNNSDVSVRKAAKYFSEKFFPISIATVHDYLQRYKEKFTTNADEIEKIMKNNCPETINDPKVRKRVLTCTEMFLWQDKNIDQVAEDLGETFWTIYRDLTVRLKTIDPELYQLVMDKTNFNRQNNLVKGSK